MGALVLAAAVAAGWAPARAQAQAVTLPGFQDTIVAAGFDLATVIDFAPDGRVFVAEKRGVLKVIKPGGQVSVVWDLRTRVNSYADRGLLGLAVDRDFASNGHLYLLYTAENNPTDQAAKKFSRLSRIKVRPDSTMEGLETTILGTYEPLPGMGCPPPSNLIDCLPADGHSHVIGTVRVDPVDGTLWVGNGDNSYGATGLDPSTVVFEPESMAGKILHVDRNGRGLPGHPYCPTNGVLTDVCTKVYAMGFRNPFRFEVRRNDGPIVGDVGASTAEEVNLVRPGRNYGWPCYEARTRVAAWGSTATCQDLYGKEGTTQGVTWPDYSYDQVRAIGGAAVVGGPVYTGDAYPADMKGTIFIGDFVRGWLRQLTFENGVFVRADDFAQNVRLVDLRQSPGGEIWYVTFAHVGRFMRVPQNRVPTAMAAADPPHGYAPLQVSFSSAGSSDPDGDALAYRWDFGDGATATGATAAHTYQSNGTYTATLTVTDPSGDSDTAEVQISVGNVPPAVTIDTPGSSFRYSVNERIDLSGHAVDAEDGTVSADRLTWRIVLVHNTHEHPLTTFTGSTGSFTTAVDHDADSHYLVTLEARDGGGLTGSQTLRIDPRTVNVTLASSPTGAPLTWDGRAITAPAVIETVVGFEPALSAAANFLSGATNFTFKSWSDGGTQSHRIVVPDHDMTLTATYQSGDSRAPETTITSVTHNSLYNTADIRFVSDEAASWFQCRVDGGSWVGCKSPWRTWAMDFGPHNIEVRAVDHSGNKDPTPASATVTVTSRTPDPSPVPKY